MPHALSINRQYSEKAQQYALITEQEELHLDRLPWAANIVRLPN